jgi:hypothetical protein
MMSRQIFSLADVINGVWCDLLFRGFQGLDFGANLFNDGSLILNWNKNDQDDLPKIDLSFFDSFFPKNICSFSLCTSKRFEYTFERSCNCYCENRLKSIDA